MLCWSHHFKQSRLVSSEWALHMTLLWLYCIRSRAWFVFTLLGADITALWFGCGLSLIRWLRRRSRFCYAFTGWLSSAAWQVCSWIFNKQEDQQKVMWPNVRQSLAEKQAYYSCWNPVYWPGRLTSELSSYLLEVPNDAYKTLKSILISFSTLSQEYCKLIVLYSKLMRSQLWTLTCPINNCNNARWFRTAINLS